jgi:WD40 repeat protein
MVQGGLPRTSPAFRMPCICAIGIAASARIHESPWSVRPQCLRISPGCLGKALTVDGVCRGGHSDDVIDAAWAPDATALLTGSIENVCVVWDVEKGKAQGRLTEHGHYVQGVAWDPSQQYVVSQSADRTCRFATHPPHSPQSQ